MRRMMFRRHALQIALPLLTACATAGSAPPERPTAAMTTTPPWPTAAAALLPAVLDDAAKRSQVPAEQLRVVSMQAVTWPDGSLGCPQPGRLYTQALVPGWRITIAAAGSRAPLQYHASQRGGWVWCPAERATPALPSGPDAAL